jgi:hypothetical protein
MVSVEHGEIQQPRHGAAYRGDAAGKDCVSEAFQWTQQEAIALCRQVETICPAFGCHVALTGGLLYKDGPRKDCDLLFYRIRQIPAIDTDGLFVALERQFAIFKLSGFGFVFKAEHKGREIDCFFPEEEVGDYPGDQPFREIEPLVAAMQTLTIEKESLQEQFDLAEVN